MAFCAVWNYLQDLMSLIGLFFPSDLTKVSLSSVTCKAEVAENFAEVQAISQVFVDVQEEEEVIETWFGHC